jgi:hypothetical protein
MVILYAPLRYGVFIGCLAHCRLHRLDEDAEGRTFEFDPADEPTVFNSTELRCIDVKLKQERAAVAPMRRSSREGSRVAARARESEVNASAKKKFLLHSDVEAVILDSLW